MQYLPHLESIRKARTNIHKVFTDGSLIISRKCDNLIADKIERNHGQFDIVDDDAVEDDED